MDNANIVLLRGIPLDSNQQNSLSWVSAQAQFDYFYSKRINNIANCTYQRKDNIIRYPANFDTISDCNYVIYQNLPHSNKWYYAFVIKIEYINDEMTLLTIKTDVLQTYYFDIIYKQSFIERKHVTDDIAGNYTFPENFELGEYQTKQIYGGMSALTDYICVVASTIDLTDTGYSTPAGAGVYGRVYSGTGYFTIRTVEALSNVLTEIVSSGQQDAIKSIFMFPEPLIPNVSSDIIARIPNFSTPNKYETPEIEKPTQLGTYTPKNKKLLTFPYTYLYITNNQGQSAVAKYELFSSDTCIFEAVGIPCESGKIIFYPKDYNTSFSQGSNNSYEYDLSVSIPAPIQCSWVSNVFDAWLAQNGASWAISGASSLVGGALGIVGSAAIGNAMGVASGALSTASSIGQSVGQIYQASIQPPQAHGNSGAGNALFSVNGYTINRIVKHIREEYAKIIDTYFEQFGYKVNQLEIIQLRTRPQWNYIKTIVCNLQGNINVTDIEEIKSYFNNGITFWHNPANVGNYELNNH